MLTSCSSGKMTWRLDTNKNEFRIYPLDIKQPVTAETSKDPAQVSPSPQPSVTP
jgi:hypothetical protein